MRRTRCGWLSFVVLCLAVVPRDQTEYAVVNGLVPPLIYFQRHDVKNYLSGRVGAVSDYGVEPDSENNQNEPIVARTLYDILGASPDDSERMLKLKYNNLAKKLHPDARIGQEEFSDAEQSLEEFRNVITAWKVLSDPKERMKYDRSLKAKELAENFEELLDGGIRNAIPFLRKTADTTMAAVETSTNAIQDVGKRVGKQQRLFEIENKCRDLSQRAEREKSRAIQMKTQLDTLYNKRLEILRTSDSDLTSTEAIRILKGFKGMDTTESFVALDDYIVTFKEIELECKNKEREQNDIAQAIRMAQKTADNALQSEQRAVQNLEGCLSNLKRERTKLEESVNVALNAYDKKQLNEMNALQTLENSLNVLDGCTFLKRSEQELSTINQLVANESLDNYIEEVGRFGSEFKTKMREWNDLAEVVRAAQQAADNALQSERRALQKLENARRELAQARTNVENSEIVVSEVNMRDIQSRMELEKVLKEKERWMEQVRAGLRQMEGEILDREADYLKEESLRLEDLERTLLEKAKQLWTKAEDLRSNE